MDEVTPHRLSEIPSMLRPKNALIGNSQSGSMNQESLEIFLNLSQSNMEFSEIMNESQPSLLYSSITSNIADDTVKRNESLCDMDSGILSESMMQASIFQESLNINSFTEHYMKNDEKQDNLNRTFDRNELCVSPLNRSENCASPFDQTKIFTSPLNETKICLSPHDQTKINTSPLNRTLTCDNSLEKTKICVSPLEKTNICVSPLNETKISEIPFDRTKERISPRDGKIDGNLLERSHFDEKHSSYEFSFTEKVNKFSFSEIFLYFII